MISMEKNFNKLLLTASLLSSSGERTTPIGGGDTQTNAW